jgi:hypothetical protein
MSKVSINFTDTEITDMIDNFSKMLCLVDAGIFEKYLKDYHSLDLENRRFCKKDILLFLATIIDFIGKKESRLRVRTSLKLNKNQILAMIFGEEDFFKEFSNDLRFFIGILFQFFFEKHDIFNHIDEMVENYAEMYDRYISVYDKNQN